MDIRGGFDDGAECVDYFEQCCDVGSVLQSTPKPIYVPPPPPPQTGNQGVPPPPPVSPQGGSGLPPAPPQGGSGLPPVPPPSPGAPTPHAQQACGYRNAEGVGFRITGNSQGESEYGEISHTFL